MTGRCDLDPTGNWAGYIQKSSGTEQLNQSRTHNVVNQTTDITETVGTAWITPAHDRAGNMTTVPKPSSLANGLTLKYDAWNRLVEVKDGQTVVGKYEYDGLNRRIKKHLDSQSPGDPNGIDKYEHYFYNADWQVLETRETTTENDQPESLQPKYQYVWSARYIDAPVLRGQAPSRQWLIYAHAPRGRRKNVKITLPDYQAVSLDVSVAGSFYLVDEKLGSVMPVE